MRDNFTYQCSECEKKYNTSGPWEFYRNKKGDRIPYGHPGPINKEAEMKGIDGFFADMLCLDCGKEVNVIVEEFNRRPVSSKGLKGFFAFLTGKNKKGDGKVSCPNCKGNNLFLSDKKKLEKNEKKTDINCPQCGKGKLIMIDHWVP